ncbi:MAG: CGNR zinc finger domain-containing protein [Actinobacteria bacterium]|nr:CGNR zinc finger domain-containing protein [Actinomycetota bacterium]MBW3648909.1 CGNR zinc finger domain-containing protein [Actinomycetota bacterium]
MHVAHDSARSLSLAVDLVNSRANGAELLPDLTALRALLDEHDVSGSRALSAEDLEEVHALRLRLRAVWTARDMRTAAAVVNGLVAEAGALPQLTDHDGHDWHLHWTAPSARVGSRLAADAGMGLAEVLREDGAARLRACEAPDCEAVFVDLSRNRSRRYCDTGNCGNRLHVAAYRARLRTVDDPGGAEATRG